MNLKRRVISAVNAAKFIYFVIRSGIFRSNSPESVLLLLQKFISLEAPFYYNSLFKGRSVQKSIELLQALISSYIVTKSNITLNQIVEVFKEEFLKRENNGRKQF